MNTRSLCAQSLIHVWLFATPWTVARQVSLFMGFSRQEYWSGLPCPPPGDLPDPGIKPGSPALQVDSLPSEPPGLLRSGKSHRQRSLVGYSLWDCKRVRHNLATKQHYLGWTGTNWDMISGALLLLVTRHTHPGTTSPLHLQSRLTSGLQRLICLKGLSGQEPLHITRSSSPSGMDFKGSIFHFRNGAATRKLSSLSYKFL